eukprot:8043129-Prorocentrum_lima.AAC.1
MDKTDYEAMPAIPPKPSARIAALQRALQTSREANAGEEVIRSLQAQLEEAQMQAQKMKPFSIRFDRAQAAVAKAETR